MPGVLQGIVDGVEGWGKYVNANGGIGGRKVQVDFIDSKLNPNEARNAIIKACADDFALVGTGALLLNTVDDEVNCAGRGGEGHRPARRRRARHQHRRGVRAERVPDHAQLGGLQHRSTSRRRPTAPTTATRST